MKLEQSIFIRKKLPFIGRNRLQERGVILFVTLIALVVLMITGIALVRSFDSSLILSGNIAFKRDLVNQGERGMYTGITWLNSSTDATRQANSPGNNYSSVILDTDVHGIPKVLTGAENWNMTATDYTDPTTGVTIRYVIDRMCNTTGQESITNCMSVYQMQSAVNSWTTNAVQTSIQVLYRISVRVTLPNNTQTFLQTTGYF